jgi:hypothetical protein
LAYGFLQNWGLLQNQGSEGALLIGIAENFKPSDEQVLAGREALARWKTTPKEQRLPLAQSIVVGKTLLKMSKASVLQALGESNDTSCEYESHLHYIMVETDQQDIDLVVELIDDAVVEKTSVRKWLW